MAHNSQQQKYEDVAGQDSPPPVGFAPLEGTGYPQLGPYRTIPFPPPGDPEKPGDDAESAFTDKSIRLGFIRKVYGILMVQLLVTTGFIVPFVLSHDVKVWTITNEWIFWAAVGLTFACIIALTCCEGVRRKAPGNFICLAVCTIAQGFLLGTFSSFFDSGSVLLAVGITAAVCIALTAFAFQTKYDFTTMGSALFVVLIVLSLFGLFTIFLPRAQFPILHIVYACIGALIFSMYLVYDTQLMMGGKHTYSISPEEYVFASLNLYLDVISLFMRILVIVGKKK